MNSKKRQSPNNPGIHCPTCQKGCARYPENPYAPFCSRRCKHIDLGNWLNESYRVNDSSPWTE